MTITVTPADNTESGLRLAAWNRQRVHDTFANNAIALNRAFGRPEARDYIPKDVSGYCRACPIAVALQRLTSWPGWEVTDRCANLIAPDGTVTFDLPARSIAEMDTFDAVYNADCWFSSWSAFELAGVLDAMDWTMYRLAALASGAESVEERPTFHYPCT